MRQPIARQAMNETEIARLIPRSARLGARRRWRCPDAARLVAYAEQRLRAGERLRLERHLADCDFCVGQLGFLAGAGDQEAVPAVPARLLGAARGARARPVLHLRPALVVTAAVAVAAAALFVLPSGERPLAPLGARPAAVDSGTPATVAPPVERPLRNGGTASAPPHLLRPVEGERIARSALECAWQGEPGALSYTVQLMNARGDLLWEERATGTRLTVPAGVPLPAGQPLYAWVVVHLADGSVLRAPAVRFEVTPD